MNQVVERLKVMITETNIITENNQIGSNLQLSDKREFNSTNNSDTSSTSNNNSCHEELSQIIQDIDKINAKETISSTISTNEQLINKNVSREEKNSNIITKEIISFILNFVNEGKSPKKYILNYLKKHNINSHNLFLNNQNDSDSIFLLGYFNYIGVETKQNRKKAFDLFINASEKNHALVQFYTGICY